MTASKTIIFIHGMYLNGLSWEGWQRRGADRGYGGQAPSWPYHDGVPAWLRANPDLPLGH
ncbi:hypothetical protein [Pseudarthrobacter sp. N5]|uniref:hypothetical protein n=1 Tax=Pseudarthrobacter sp. N5 TaxID=3418416 RepID=UPI003CF6461A